MNYEPQTDDELLRGVLYRADDAAVQEDSDEADELLALYMEGHLNGEDLATFFAYLDTHPDARRAVGLGAKYIEDHPSQAPVPSIRYGRSPMSDAGWIAGALRRLSQWTADKLGGTALQLTHGGPIAWARERQLALVLASALLVATTAVLWHAWRPPSQIQLLALRGGPSLIDFGLSPDVMNAIEIRGADAEDHSPTVKSLLDAISNPSERVQLKQAYDFLRQNDLHEARSLFQRVIDEHPESYYAWLGQGTASHIEQDFNQAETAFREALKHNANSISARIGLAMTLTRLGKNREALAEWRQVQIERLPPSQQGAVAREIQRLEAL